jgi:pimeloyl-ACP methyl ester carboxylesterase
MKVAAALLAIAVALYAGACAYLFFNQGALLYYPTPETGVTGADRVSIQSGGETLYLWHIGWAGSGGNAIIYFGGNAEDVAQNVPLFRDLFPHSDVYLVNYRGYGGSTGTPSEAALFADALTVYDYAQARHSAVSVIGRSLGSGVAVYLATQREIGRLVLVTPYDSIENVARRAYPAFPVSLLLRDKYASASRIARVKAPILFILAADDDVVPRANSEALIAHVPVEQKIVAVIPGTTHHTVETPPAFADALHAFFV